MANVGTVQSVTGTVIAVAEDGTERVLRVGDNVAENEKIITNGGTIAIAFADGTTMDLGNDSSIVLNDDVLSQEAEGVTSQRRSDAEDEVAELQEALTNNPNFDPANLPATAAGTAAGGGAGNNGHNLVSVDYLNPDAPVEAGFDTTGINTEFLQGDEELPPATEDDPVVSISVEVEVEVDVEIDPENPGGTPPTDGIPTGDFPVVVSGNGASVLEGTSEGTKPVVFIISLDKVFDVDVQVTYQLIPQTATNPDDWFDGGSIQTVTIPAGSTTFEVTVDIVEDHIVEGNEDFEITLISAEGATINPESNSATITIYDDDIPPLAVNDVYSTEEDTPITINAGSGTLANDSGDDSGEVLTVTGYEQPENGTVSLNEDGSFTYTPNADFNGQDSFAYSMTDGFNGESSATVTIDVDANPDAVNDAFTTDEDVAISNTVVPNDDQGDAPATFANTSNPENGSLVFNEDGTFTYTPNNGFSGSDSFTYQITDADGDTDTATVSLTVTPGAIPPPPIAAPVISIADAQGEEGDPLEKEYEFAAFSGTAQIDNAPSTDDTFTYLTFNVTRTGDVSGTSTVEYTVNPDSAGTPSDYFDNLSGTVSFAAGSSSETIRIEITDDLVAELTEIFTVTLSSPVGATIGDGDAIGTIIDNDITLSVLSAEGDDGAVDESALPTVGSGGGSTTTAGTFDINTGGDPVSEVIVDGTTIAIGGTTNITTGTYGTLAVTEAGGEYSWVYTLDSNTSLHGDPLKTGADDQYPEDTYDVVAIDSDRNRTDTDGVQSSEQLVVQINDDGPIAIADPAIQDVNENADTATATLASLIAEEGADGASVTHVGGIAIVEDELDSGLMTVTGT